MDEKQMGKITRLISLAAGGAVCAWTGIIAFTFPVCAGIIYMDITGHAKGYAYELGSERDISMMVGAAELILWLLAALPAGVCLWRKLWKKRPVYAWIALAVWVGLAVLGIYTAGGWEEIGRYFG